MTREEARNFYSDYLDNALDSGKRDALQAFLASEPEAASELFALERTLTLLHRLPPREPSLDMWREFAPKVEAFRAERRLSLGRRIRQNWSALRAQFSEGLILWTQALASRTHARWEQHLLGDPLAGHRR